METDKDAVLELAKSVQSLSDNVVMLELALIGSVIVSVGFMWFLIKYYENKTNDRADEFNARKADKLDDKNDIDGLLAYCEKFIRKYPNDVTVNFYIALAYFRKEQFDQAKTYFEKSVKLNPNMTENVQGYLDVIEDELYVPEGSIKN